MKIFKLDMRAYHTLELVQHVCISESGHSVTRRNSRARYYILLDKVKQHWIYYRLSKIKDDVGEYILINPPGLCIIHAGFNQVSNYN